MKILLKSLLMLFLIYSNSEARGQWTRLSETFDGGNVLTIKTIGKKLYVSTHVFPPKHSRIYESSDNGQSWIPIDSTTTYNDAFHKFTIKDSSIVVADANSGIYKSKDNLKTWDQIFHIPNLPSYVSTIMDSIIVVGTGDGQLYQSKDNGVTWKLTYNGSIHVPIFTLNSDRNRIFAGIIGGVLISSDEGANWSSVSFGTHYYGDVIYIEIKDNTIFATDGNSIYISSDNGINWKKTTNNLSSGSYKYCLGSFNSSVLCGTQYGVYITTDNGQNWISANSGLGKTRVNAFDNLGNYLFAAANDGVYRIDTVQIANLQCDYIAVEATPDKRPSCSTCSDGTATAYALSGIAPYTYSWNTTPIQNTQTATGLSNGYHSFCITDSKGCVACDSVYLDYLSRINVAYYNLPFNIFPNPVTERLNIDLPTSMNKSQAEIYNILGKVEYSSLLTKPNTTVDVSNLQGGLYIIQITSGDKIGRQKFIKQ